MMHRGTSYIPTTFTYAKKHFLRSLLTHFQVKKKTEIARFSSSFSIKLQSLDSDVTKNRVNRFHTSQRKNKDSKSLAKDNDYCIDIVR